MSGYAAITAPQASVRDAARLMEADTGALPVEENDRLVGTVTDRDIAIRAVAEDEDLQIIAQYQRMTHYGLAVRSRNEV